ALRRLELFRVLLGLGEGAQVVLELLAYRAENGLEALALEDHREAGAHLDLPADVLLGRVHRERRAEVGDELLDDRPRLAQARLADALLEPRAVLALELLGELGVEPLLLAGLAPQVLLRLPDLGVLARRELEGLEDLVLRNLVRARFDHRQRILGPDDDEVEGALPVLEGRERRVDDELAVDLPDANGPDRPEERERRDHQ